MSRFDDDEVELQLEIVRDEPTDLAILVETDNKEKVWLPRSQITINRTSKAGGALITMPEWLALEKGLI